MKCYTLGFIFNKDLSEVLLMEKQRPDWQRGKFNGIGGKIEEGEKSRACLVREIKEETGLITNENEWVYIGRLESNSYKVDVYTLVYMGAMSDAFTTTDEKVEWVSMVSLPKKIIPNLRWMIPFALEKLQEKDIIDFIVRNP